ncbi:MAG: hypothetical protein SCK29_06410 [Bacillota bacterium]|nr:hypothetical protein [Bacillota bacterium]MDW7683739.1 hypothetical protein [Bacillota bacterium]
MQDRFTRGFLAGLFTGVIINIIDYIAFILNLTDTRYVDIAARLVYGTRSHNLFEFIFAYLAQLAFSAFLGVIYSYLLIKITSENHLLKGWLFGVAVWFFTFAIIVMFRVPGISQAHSPTAFTNAVLASIFGITLTQTLAFLDRRYANE